MRVLLLIILGYMVIAAVITAIAVVMTRKERVKADDFADVVDRAVASVILIGDIEDYLREVQGGCDGPEDCEPGEGRDDQ